MAPYRFAADRMLGRLATWLRLIGQDTAYEPQLTGRALAQRARAEDRIILTRDTRLRKAPDIALLFIASDRFREQLQQVMCTYELDPYAALFSRCARCNRALAPLAVAAAAPHVPPYVAQTARRFVRCPSCRRIYWPGTHAERIRAELQNLGFPAT